ncbi:protein YLS3 [Sesamum angolense]|uniref:Protein YLS3 n=1 Tax=Sesamum angolense TaxID=2727404 RepID=A0AAE1XCG8_9LAMI|nr:protein YLS3 [Sesamum angolense]
MVYSNSKKASLRLSRVGLGLGLRLLPLQCTLVLMLLSSIARCEVDKDKEKCGDELVGLATCLPYVSGESKTPPIDCCAGLKQVLHKSPECMCLLVKDRNDPSLGLKINATLALALPSQCHAPANVSHCPALLHLPPNSPDAKVFEDFANSGKKGNATTTSSSSVAAAASGDDDTSSKRRRSDGGKKMVSASGGVLALVMYLVHNLGPGCLTLDCFI